VPATVDRKDIEHFAGRFHLSPALRDGAPVLVAGSDPTVVRCGWERFFRAMSAHDVALAFRPDDGASARFVPRAEARRDPVHRPSLARALDDARRFVAALTRREPTPR
jgi:hypothetical protein